MGTCRMWRLSCFMEVFGIKHSYMMWHEWQDMSKQIWQHQGWGTSSTLNEQWSCPNPNWTTLQGMDGLLGVAGMMTLLVIIRIIPSFPAFSTSKFIILYKLYKRCPLGITDILLGVTLTNGGMLKVTNRPFLSTSWLYGMKHNEPSKKTQTWNLGKPGDAIDFRKNMNMWSISRTMTGT